MPVIRNPFRRTPAAPPTTTTAFNNVSSDSVITENLSQSQSQVSLGYEDNARPRTTLAGSKPKGSVSAISIPRADDEGYKLSVKSESSSHSSKVWTPPSEEEQFVIPRESFECYRRSFDISARSPVTDIAPSRGSFDLRPATRASLDVRPTTRASLDVRPSRASLDVQPSARLSLDQRPLRRGPGFSSTLEDAFEEVKLTDEAARPKKRSIFSRFGADHGAGRDTAVMGRKEATAEVAESELRPITAGRD
ncbi:uncharacterized protein LAJ45_07379 [Morchella importuna]|uniref:uncharacterized protein n=1 Tax=Morchella importuna TaxID=1174673 RepID=UPI001E8E31E7|nr:uncharacterized protein LAJ45_07379 [Morchella importuna]KAH8148668.1 hypothetical protein LAJ45_07379 [Morchella importuna]